jgi:hypothetical protein
VVRKKKAERKGERFAFPKRDEGQRARSYRVETQRIGAKYARVRYVRTGGFDVSEEHYRAEGYKPQFDDLLSREDFDTANRPRRRNRSKTD